jgi:hypothetical protein
MNKEKILLKKIIKKIDSTGNLSYTINHWTKAVYINDLLEFGYKNMKNLTKKQLKDRIIMTNNAFNILPEYKTPERMLLVSKMEKLLNILLRTEKIEKIKKSLKTYS